MAKFLVEKVEESEFLLRLAGTVRRKPSKAYSFGHYRHQDLIRLTYRNVTKMLNAVSEKFWLQRYDHRVRHFLTREDAILVFRYSMHNVIKAHEVDAEAERFVSDLGRPAIWLLLGHAGNPYKESGLEYLSTYSVGPMNDELFGCGVMAVSRTSSWAVYSSVPVP